MFLDLSPQGRRKRPQGLQVGGSPSRRRVTLTKTAVTRKRKVEKSIRRCQIDRLREGYKRAIDEIRGPIAKNGFSGQNPKILAPSDPFLNFSFPSYGRFREGDPPTQQKVLPHLTVRALTDSNSPSARSALALRARALRARAGLKQDENGQIFLTHILHSLVIHLNVE